MSLTNTGSSRREEPEWVASIRYANAAPTNLENLDGGEAGDIGLPNVTRQRSRPGHGSLEEFETKEVMMTPKAVHFPNNE
jgi:hypothetical protein